MSDFKSYIRDKYNQEVQPKYSEDAWQKFAAHAQIQPEKKNRKWLLWLFFGLFIVGGTSIAYLSNREAHEATIADTIINYQENDDLSASEGYDLMNMADEPSGNDQGEGILDQSDNMLTNVGESKTSSRSENIAFNSYDSQNAKNQSPSYTDTDTNNQNNQTGEQPLLPGNTSEGLDKYTSEVLEDNPPLSPDNAEITNAVKFRTPLVMSLLPVKHIALLSIDPELIENNKVLPAHRMVSPGFLFAGIDMGAGRSYHRSIDDHGVYLFSGHLGYGINERFRIRASAGITQSRYSSRVLNRSLGLRSINYPVREARLDNVNSTTTYIETGIGVEYTTPAFAGFSITGGPGLLLVKEINRKLDYKFNQGDMDLESINVEVQEHPTHPVNLSLNIGVNYHMSPDMNLTLKGEYLKALKQSDVELLRQARVKLGIEKKF